MKPVNLTQKSKSRALGVLVLLAVVLGLLFWKCFLPKYVLFSNDGPLGQQMAACIRLPAAFTGVWYDLNFIGTGGGALTPSVSLLIHWLLGPVGYAKFFTPLALFILGFGAWTFLRQLKLTPLAAILGALAAMLSSTFFSDACWGTASHQIAFGMDFFALALIVSNTAATPRLVRWVRLALAGFAVGINVIEAADIGAIFSVFVAAFALYQSFTEEGFPVKKFGRGVGRIAMIAAFAGFIATQTIVTLVGIGITGVVGMGQSEAAKAAHWNTATQWSLPKIETLGIVVPGLFGYRMDTPDGGNYWGAVGRDAAWESYIASGEKGPAPSQDPYIRFCGTGNYVGVLVFLVVWWTIAQSLRRQNSIFSKTHRQFIWFWTAVLVISLLFAYGRFAPFYHLVYALPYFSTIRNPIKFLFVFTWAIVIIFGYGIHGLSRRYLDVPAVNSAPPLTQLRAWWTKNRGFDRNWVSICIVVFIGSLLGWLIYATQKPNLVAYLQTVAISDGPAVAAFSIRQVGWFILFFALAAALMALILSGAFAGRRAKLGGILLGLLLVADLGRADLPWTVFWNYPQKYASNPIVDILRSKPYEHRVAYLLSPPLRAPSQFGLFDRLYKIEWIQQLFPYYNIQSLDIVQMSRMPDDVAAFQGALWPRGPDTVYLIARRWELTNTRYLLGPAVYLDVLNQQIDPAPHPLFRIVQRFNIVPKPGIENTTQLRLSELTAVPDTNGEYALFEFTGALPRVKLYADWQISTNNNATLQTLASTNFNAWKRVLVSTPLPTSPATNALNENPGTVEFKHYTPANIWFSAHAHTPSVLLLNSKFDPNWHVFVDGKPAPLLRCNYIMRGVYLTPGEHTVQFKFAPPIGPLYISLSAIGVGILLCGFLLFSTRHKPSS